MALNLLQDKGVPLAKQRFTWKELVQRPYSKLDDDAFTRVRVILMNGIESEAIRFSHACARMNRDLQQALAQVRRVEQHQQTLVNWLNPADQSPLETTIGFEQVAIEVTASVAESEPDPYLAQVYRFGLLEDFDHLYRYAALMDRVAGKDANILVQSYSDILPGRPTSLEHRHPHDDLRTPYERTQAALLTKLNALTIMAGEHQTHDYYMTVGPTFADPLARQLYAEIASIEEQHVTQYESIIDATETWLEKWLLHEATEVYNYYSCVEYEGNPHVKKIWERCLEYELGHLRFVAELFENTERRDAAEVLSTSLPAPIRYESHRAFVRDTLRREVQLSAVNGRFVDRSEETEETRDYRHHMNSEGSPSDTAAAGYIWTPGTSWRHRRTAGNKELGEKEQGMKQNATLGTNRTGTAVAPQRTQEMLTGMEEFPPTSQGNSQALAAVRIAYAKEAEPIGSVPTPAGVTNKIRTAAKAVTGEKPTLLLDKLGERLAFERSGTRLYEALVSKHDAFGSFSGGPSRADLEDILQEEYEHFTMLRSIMEQFGGDPTAVTPSANLQATVGYGITKVIVDPRTTLLQSLEAILVAELADHAGWETLKTLAQKAGEDKLAAQCQQAHTTEEEHLTKVRHWVAAGQGHT